MRINEFSTEPLSFKALLGALQSRFGLARVGGEARVYTVGNKLGVAYLIHGGPKGVGLTWERGSKVVSQVFVWSHFDASQSPDLVADIPVGATLSVIPAILDFVERPQAGVLSEDVMTDEPTGETISGVQIMARAANGEMFVVPGMEKLAASIEARLSKNTGKTMEQQYAELRDKIELVVSGRSHNIKSLLIYGAPSSGKALALDTPIPTPDGWTTMGDIKVGDQLYDENGRICSVTFATPVQHNRKCFNVVFDDGTEVVADADHRWFTTTNASRKKLRVSHSVKNTQEIAKSLLHKGKRFNHQIPNTLPVVGNNGDLPVDSYLLGLWLGEGLGTKAFSFDADELIEHFGILGNRTIPEIYLRASAENRLALLQGLMDSHGTISKVGSCKFSAKREPLAVSFLELANSLGIKATLSRTESRYHIKFTTTQPVFRHAQKRDRIPDKVKNAKVRSIVSCDEVASVPVRCITVDSPSHLFLCSRGFIPTHNTFTVMQVVKALGLQEGTDYVVKKGSITDFAAYRALIQNIDGLIIFDDCDSVVATKVGKNMIKGALDTYPVRDLSYDNANAIDTDSMIPEDRMKFVDAMSRVMRGTASEEDISLFDHYAPRDKSEKTIKKAKNKNGDEEFEIPDPLNFLNSLTGKSDERLRDLQEYFSRRLPNKIDYRGRMIFISNMGEDEWDSAILTRTFRQYMSFGDDEMLDFIDRIKDTISAPSLTPDQKQEVVDWVRHLNDSGGLKSPINFRLIQQAFDLRLTPNWKSMVSDL